MSHVAAIRHAATCGMDALLKMALAKAEELDRLSVVSDRNAIIEECAKVCEARASEWLSGRPYDPSQDDLGTRKATEGLCAADDIRALKIAAPQGHESPSATPGTSHEPAAAATSCVVIPTDTWDIFIKDYNRYVGGDLKMPFSLFRETMAMLVSEAKAQVPAEKE